MEPHGIFSGLCRGWSLTIPLNGVIRRHTRRFSVTLIIAFVWESRAHMLMLIEHFLIKSKRNVKLYA